MDGLSMMLASHRGQDAFVLRCEMAPPWSIRIADEASVSVLVMTGGSCTLTRDGQDPVTLDVGDVAVVRGPVPYDVADRSDRAPGVIIEPGQICRILDAEMGIAPLAGRSWGNAAGGPCSFLAGTYELPGQVTGRLLSAMPDLAVVPAPRCDPALIAALNAELAVELPGQDVVVDRYVDLVLVSAVRAWFASPDTKAPLWWTAQSDPVVARVLSLMHDRPGERWTLEGLASAVGYSRAGLSRRFTALVGQSPMKLPHRVAVGGSPPRCWSPPTPRSRRSRGRSGTPTPSPSARRSSGPTSARHGPSAPPPERTLPAEGQVGPAEETFPEPVDGPRATSGDRRPGAEPRRVPAGGVEDVA